MRVATLATHPCTGDRLPNTIITSDGKGEASGFEFEIVYAPTDRWRVNVNLGILETNYLATGTFANTGLDLSGPIVIPVTDLTGTGISSLDAPFAYAPEQQRLARHPVRSAAVERREPRVHRQLWLDGRIRPRHVESPNPARRERQHDIRARLRRVERPHGVHAQSKATGRRTCGRRTSRTSSTSTAASTRAPCGASTSRSLVSRGKSASGSTSPSRPAARRDDATAGAATAALFPRSRLRSCQRRRDP